MLRYSFVLLLALVFNGCALTTQTQLLQQHEDHETVSDDVISFLNYVEHYDSLMKPAIKMINGKLMVGINGSPTDNGCSKITILSRSSAWIPSEKLFYEACFLLIKGADKVKVIKVKLQKELNISQELIKIIEQTSIRAVWYASHPVHKPNSWFEEDLGDGYTVAIKSKASMFWVEHNRTCNIVKYKYMYKGFVVMLDANIACFITSTLSREV